MEIVSDPTPAPPLHGRGKATGRQALLGRSSLLACYWKDARMGHAARLSTSADFFKWTHK